jgi:hypothetical protein
MVCSNEMPVAHTLPFLGMAKMSDNGNNLLGTKPPPAKNHEAADLLQWGRCLKWIQQGHSYKDSEHLIQRYAAEKRPGAKKKILQMTGEQAFPKSWNWKRYFLRGCCSWQ